MEGLSRVAISNPDTKTCGHCGLDVCGSVRTTLACLHSFHPSCFHTYAVRSYQSCPVCSVSFTIVPIHDDNDEDEYNKNVMDLTTHIHHPINFGDDYAVENLVESRKVIMNRIKQNALQVGGNSDYSISNIRNTVKPQPPQQAKDGYGSMITSQLNYGVSVMSSAKTMFAEALVSNGDHSTSDVDSMLNEANVTLLLYHSIASYLMVTRGGVTARGIVESKVGISKIVFDYLYEMDDFIVFGLTWSDMLAMGLDSTKTFKRLFKQNPTLPPTRFSITKLVTIWKVDFKMILAKVCKGKLRKFGGLALHPADYMIMGFNLRIPAVQNYIKSARQMFVDFKHLDLNHWGKLGMTCDHLRRIGVTSKMIKDQFIVLSPDSFRDSMGFELDELDQATEHIGEDDEEDDEEDDDDEEEVVNKVDLLTMKSIPKKPTTTTTINHPRDVRVK